MAGTLIDDVYALVRFPRDPRSGLLGLELPSDRVVARLYKEQGIRASIPDGSSEFWSELTTRAYTELKERRKQTPPPPSVPQPGTPRPPSPPTASGEEARIKQMKGAAAMEECKAKRIAVIAHHTNPGITAMRAKNALLLHVKRNPPPVPSPQVKPARVPSAPAPKKKVQWNVS